MNHQQSTDPQAQRDAIYQYAIAPAGIWFDISKAAYDFWTKREVSKTRIVYANPQATEPAWRPIETAPKDGSEILLFGDGRVTSGNWSAPSEIPRLIYRDGFAPEEEWDEWEPYWASWDGGFTEEHPPTHWQPLPAAPEAKQ